MSAAVRHLVVLIGWIVEPIAPFGLMMIIELDSLWPWSSNKPLICCTAYFPRCDAHAEVEDTMLLCSVANNWSANFCKQNCCFKKLVSLLSKVRASFLVDWRRFDFHLWSFFFLFLQSLCNQDWTAVASNLKDAASSRVIYQNVVPLSFSKYVNHLLAFLYAM